MLAGGLSLTNIILMLERTPFLPALSWVAGIRPGAYFVRSSPSLALGK